MKKYLIVVLSGLVFISSGVQAEVYPYAKEGQKFEGVFLKSAKKNSPAIVLIHNWMGITPETEKQAKRFQKLGYNVLAADIYGAGVRPKTMEEASAQASLYKKDRALFRSRIHLAIDELSKLKGVDTSKIAIVGYCFGGTGALEAARSGEPIRAVVSFHGGLDSPSPKDGASIKGKVLALHGAIDPYVPSKDVEAFEKEMQTNSVDYELVKYGGTVHSFTEVGAGTDIQKGAAYNAHADERSFARAKEFLKEVF